jgi:hypothetical protein
MYRVDNPYYAAGRSAASQFKFKNLKKVNAQNRQSFFFPLSILMTMDDSSALIADILLTESSSTLHVDENGGMPSSASGLCPERT